jgi:hypothetical protein
MNEREGARLQPGLEVFDRDGHKLGTVARVHEPAGAGASGVLGSPAGGYLEVTTGLLSRLGLAAPLFVPLAAVRDVTEGGVFLTADRGEADRADWHTRPDAVAGVAETRAAPATDVVVPAPGGPAGAAAAPADWAVAAPAYRRRWEERHGLPGARWEAYEPRYRFAWEMARHPAYAGQGWPAVAAELGARWEVLHPETEWDTVADAVRDAWEHVAGAAPRR